ncbi:hypothetical protein QQ056_11680 [Oscillatoria laete-virens NRMC-F 0139]|nr:hypothetical protein [Oscillatoria laete-virens NRMC-F 0139]
MSKSVVWNDETGFEFISSPKTPPRHWGKLAAAIPEEVKNRIRRMELIPQ